MEISLTRLTRYSIITFLRDHLHMSVVNDKLDSTDRVTYFARRAYWSPAYHYEDGLYDSSAGVTPIKIYRNGAEVSKYEYSIDYVGGRVKFVTEQSDDDVITASYSYNWADIEESWPDRDTKRPVVTVESGPIRERGLELGGGLVITGLLHINILALNVSQRDDMADHVRNLLRLPMPLIDFNKGQILLQDGSYNTAFDPVTQRAKMIVPATHPEINPNPTGGDSPEERTRSYIEFRCQIVDYPKI